MQKNLAAPSNSESSRDGTSIEKIRGRKATENRTNSLIVQRPKIDWFKVHAGLASHEISVTIVADGKHHELIGTRHTLLQILAEAADGLRKMEPGK
jgi:hypothetical protein